jgi:hypothetical protein
LAASVLAVFGFFSIVTLSSFSSFVDVANMPMPSVGRTPALAFKSDDIAREATRFLQAEASV